jgi:hypothetical protein
MRGLKKFLILISKMMIRDEIIYEKIALIKVKLKTLW